MSEEAQPIELTDEEAARTGRKRLREIATSGGKLTKRFKCQSCGSTNEVEVEKIDPDELLRVVKYLDEVSKKDGGTETQEAERLLKQLDELSDEELANLAVKLGNPPS